MPRNSPLPENLGWASVCRVRYSPFAFRCRACSLTLLLFARASAIRCPIPGASSGCMLDRQSNADLFFLDVPELAQHPVEMQPLPVDVAHPDHHRRLLAHGAEALLALPQARLGVLALAEVHAGTEDADGRSPLPESVIHAWSLPGNTKPTCCDGPLAMPRRGARTYWLGREQREPVSVCCPPPLRQPELGAARSAPVPRARVGWPRRPGPGAEPGRADRSGC